MKVLSEKCGKRLISGILGISIGCAIIAFYPIFYKDYLKLNIDYGYINGLNIVFGNVLSDESIFNSLGSQVVAAMADIFGIFAICLYVSIAIFFMFKPSKFKRSSMAIIAVIILSFPSINVLIVALKSALSCGILAYMSHIRYGQKMG